MRRARRVRLQQTSVNDCLIQNRSIRVISVHLVPVVLGGEKNQFQGTGSEDLVRFPPTADTTKETGREALFLFKLCPHYHSSYIHASTSTAKPHHKKAHDKVSGRRRENWSVHLSQILYKSMHSKIPCSWSVQTSQNTGKTNCSWLQCSCWQMLSALKYLLCAHPIIRWEESFTFFGCLLSNLYPSFLNVGLLIGFRC